MTTKTVYLHVGPPKTGSTSIQASMVRNEPALLEQGYRYLEAGRLRPGEQAWVLRSGGRNKEVGPSLTHNLLNWALLDRVESGGGVDPAELWPRAVREIEACSEANCIVSGEGFYHLPDELLLRLRAYLQDHHVKILFVDRDSYARATSLYGQLVRSGHLYCSFRDFVDHHYPEKLREYEGRRTAFRQIFGAENFVGLSFEEAVAAPFFTQPIYAAIGVDYERLDLRKEPSNPRLSDVTLNQLLLLNRIWRTTLGGRYYSVYRKARNAILSNPWRSLSDRFAPASLRRQVITPADRQYLKDQLVD